MLSCDYSHMPPSMGQSFTKCETKSRKQFQTFIHILQHPHPHAHSSIHLCLALLFWQRTVEGFLHYQSTRAGPIVPSPLASSLTSSQISTLLRNQDYIQKIFNPDTSTMSGLAMDEVSLVEHDRSDLNDFCFLCRILCSS